MIQLARRRAGPRQTGGCARGSLSWVVLRFAVAVLVCLVARLAHAQFPPITSRAYAIDLYDGVAIGNTDMVGMGGAGAAVVLGTAGVLLNPSAIAVRPATDHDPWSLDYHVDFLTGRFSSDYDNNGQVASGGASLVTLGFGGRYHDWAMAVTATIQIAPVAGSSPHLDASAARGRFSLARWIDQLDLAVGAGLQVAQFELQQPDKPDAAERTVFSITGTGAIAGATWLPRGESFRIGGSIDGPINGDTVETDCVPGSDPAAEPDKCNGYIPPDRVRAPWRLVAGGAFRWAGSAWNQPVATRYRDERAVTIAADVVVTGATTNGYGVEAFGMQQLQRSGRHTAVSLRGGGDYEWLPGRLRVRAGSYWEPSRFDGVPGRLHATFGTDVRVFEFHAWGLRRGRISLTGDVASRYRNVALSIGLWH